MAFDPIFSIRIMKNAWAQRALRWSSCTEQLCTGGQGRFYLVSLPLHDSNERAIVMWLLPDTAMCKHSKGADEYWNAVLCRKSRSRVLAIPHEVFSCIEITSPRERCPCTGFLTCNRWNRYSARTRVFEWIAQKTASKLFGPLSVALYKAVVTGNTTVAHSDRRVRTVWRWADRCLELNRASA